MSREQLEIDAQYAGYLDRQDADILAFRRDEALRPARPDLDYGRHSRPFQRSPPEAGAHPARDPGPGGRIEGVTAGALTLVLAHVKRAPEAALSA